ncbi:hypothetical protein MA16_Dca026113 [Dendrobium catenatum]|uniref:DUF4216 domain-containing protein n=1 Tax=Dendrobium catenatum TaxID=906689 RepID=A0A2I0W4B8_9ASPA|nr:hypothetical protein MA16_Dca026113 [Dendrobium catenatum]
MDAALLWTINNFLAYGILSGHKVHGYKAYPICDSETSSQYLRNKICYMGHRCFLPKEHKWRKSKKFNGKHEVRVKPQNLSGDEILSEMESLKDLKFGQPHFTTLSWSKYNLVRWYVLNNYEELNPYLIHVNVYSGCIVNGVMFLINQRDIRRVTQNSGVSVQGSHKVESINFYGVLTDVVNLSYNDGTHVVLFKCKWFDLEYKKPILIDDNFTSINISKSWFDNDPYVLAGQFTQVLYVQDTKLKG